MSTFFISDTHFGHRNIIKFADRPFDSLEEMEEVIVANWNCVISPEDTVYHLGDVAFCGKEDIERIIFRLNGNKILIMGNHDKCRTATFWRSVGFDSVSKTPIAYNEDIIVSHEPMPYNSFNIYGHVHVNSDCTLDGHFPPKRGYNVNVEFNNYTPVSFEKIQSKYGEKTNEEEAQENES